MAFCGNCGMKVAEGTRFCPGCGTGIVSVQTTTGQQAGNMEKTQGMATEYTQEDIEQNKVMALLAYLGILFLVPLFGAPNSKYARYHANQGLVLCLAAVAFGIVYAILVALLLAISWRLVFFTAALAWLWLAYPVMIVIGIVNAVNGKTKELPLIGKIKILK